MFVLLTSIHWEMKGNCLAVISLTVADELADMSKCYFQTYASALRGKHEAC